MARGLFVDRRSPSQGVSGEWLQDEQARFPETSVRQVEGTESQRRNLRLAEALSGSRLLHHLLSYATPSPGPRSPIPLTRIRNRKTPSLHPLQDLPAKESECAG